MTRSAAAFAFLLVTACNSEAQNAPAPIAGDGGLACSAYASAFSDANAGKPELLAARGRFAQWVVGYLSGYNAMNAKRFKAAFGVFGDAKRANDNFALWWVLDVCKANPQATVHKATEEFIAWRLREESKP